MRSPFAQKWGRSGLTGAAPPVPYRYSIGGKAPAVVAAPAAGVYAINGGAVGFDSLLSFSRTSAAWKRNALGHWVKVLAGEPRTGHHIWKGGKLVSAGLALCSEVRTQYLPYVSSMLANWNAVSVVPVEVENGFVQITTTGETAFPRFEKSGGIGATSGTFTLQAEVKKGTSGGIRLRVAGTDIDGSGETASVYRYDFSTGLLTKVGGSAVVMETYVKETEPGVFLIAFTFTATAVSAVNIYPTYTNTPDLSVIFRNLALSEGHTPIDFIPNDTASQISIAAESIQIDPVKLAKAVGVFGPELNPDLSFATVWDTANAGVSVVDGTLVFDNVAVGDRSYFIRSPASVGDMILLEVDVDELTSGTLNALYGGIGNTITVAGKYAFLVPSTSAAATAGVFAGTVTTNAVISRFSAREVTMPEALTFLMKGTMTRAKEPESYDNAVPLKWVVDGNNYLDVLVSTNAAHTGYPYFRSTAGGVFGGVAGEDDALALGVEVPFSLAFVLSPTEIEGFYNGVSTGKVAYGGMANLLSSPLQLFPFGTATLEEFCIWTEALPSAAMQEATS